MSQYIGEILVLVFCFAFLAVMVAVISATMLSSEISRKEEDQ